MAKPAPKPLRITSMVVTPSTIKMGETADVRITIDGGLKPRTSDLKVSSGTATRNPKDWLDWKVRA